MKTFLALILHILISSFLFAQAPQGIPYQAVMRNEDGTVMASSAVSLTFMIHDGSATGTVVYQETHALTSNAQGLVSCVVGNGVVSQGNFSSINWGSGAKFLHVMMDTTDLGTQQMLSVPYALYAGACDIVVSVIGDTLYSGDSNFVVIPGISSANANNNIQSSGLGAEVLPGNITCAAQFINVLGCNGQTTLTYDGRTYDLVEIGGQCWFADNLATDQYRNGDLIPTGLTDNEWSTTINGAYAVYDNSQWNDSIYGKLYNWFAVQDARGVCPKGYHVATDCEWMHLEKFIGIPDNELELQYSWRGDLQGAILRDNQLWNSTNLDLANPFGFSSAAAGIRLDFGNYGGIGNEAHWWTSGQIGRHSAIGFLGVFRQPFDEQRGLGVRCSKDLNFSLLSGCTDASACNFLVNANHDDGSCLYQNATCDDGNANTTYDVINASCQCAGTANDTLDIVIGQDYQGGKVAYIFQPEDAGYIAGETHGLIAAAQDLPGTYTWGCYGITISGADGQAIGTGAQNTLDIVNRGCGDAAQACADLVLNGYDDWFLPSLGELEQLYFNLFPGNDFQNLTFWSSSEGFSYHAWYFNFFFGANIYEKQAYNAVRAVRAF
jgi:uncharacterized protein (TIGR02145 family)